MVGELKIATESIPSLTDARYAHTTRGWIDGDHFEDFFEMVVVPWAEEQGPGPKVVFGDNHRTHFGSIKVMTLCKKYNIRHVPLPPNTTHWTQVLVRVFYPHA